MESHQTDERSQASSVGLNEQELSSVSGGQFTPEQLQAIDQTTQDIARSQKKPMDWKTLGRASLIGTMAGFGTHVAGEETHNAFSHH